MIYKSYISLRDIFGYPLGIFNGELDRHALINPNSQLRQLHHTTTYKLGGLDRHATLTCNQYLRRPYPY